MTVSAQVVLVHVKPGSRKGPLVEADPDTAGSFTVDLQQRAGEGAANDALVRLLAKHFGVPRSAVGILRGHHSRIKQVLVERA